MKISAGQFFLLLAFGAILRGVSGCTTNEPSNEAVRPWDTPENWEGGMPLLNQQHE
jgi:hypothetical protein